MPPPGMGLGSPYSESLMFAPAEVTISSWVDLRPAMVTFKEYHAKGGRVGADGQQAILDIGAVLGFHQCHDRGCFQSSGVSWAGQGRLQAGRRVVGQVHQLHVVGGDGDRAQHEVVGEPGGGVVESCGQSAA